MSAICQNSLADAPWLQDRTRRLPGVQPLDPADWLVVDDAYADQMADRARILKAHRSDVLQKMLAAADAVEELFETVLDHLGARDEFHFSDDHCTRPDGVQISLSGDDPLAILCRLVSEDFCIMQKNGAEHELTAAILCFPASWTLAQKFGRSLAKIHEPVDDYDDAMTKRVQRLFDAVQVGKPLWRANALQYQDPQLYQPRRDDARRSYSEPGKFIRTERQCIVRLPQTQAVVFSIQTRQVHIDNLTAEQLAGLREHPIDPMLDQTT